MSHNTEPFPTNEANTYGNLYSDERIEQAIEDSYERMDYRPVAVAVIRDGLNRVLLVESAKAPGTWSLPQGGIERGETLGGAIVRELHEEVGTTEDQIKIGALTDIVDIDAPSDRADKRGFNKGKRYFTTQIQYRGDGRIVLQAEEISGAIWVFDDMVPKIMDSVREEKRALVERALRVR